MTPASAWPALLMAQQEVEERGVCHVEGHVSSAFDALQELVWADRASMIVSARVTADMADPVAGWRLAWLYSPGAPRFSRLIRPIARALKWSTEQRQNLASGVTRAETVHCVGPDVPPTHRRFNTLIGVAHRAIATVPVTSTLEVHLVFNRKTERFTHDEVATSLAAAHVFRRMARRWCAQLGILDGRVLSRREREVLVCLLRGLSEKAGAEQLGMKPGYFHQIVVRLYSKLRVDSRAALLAKCLEPPPSSGELWSGKPLMPITTEE